MHLFRRLFLLLAVGSSIWVYQTVSLEPLVTIEPLDLAAHQSETSDAYLAQLPFEGYVAEVAAGRLLETSAEEWKALYRKLVSAAESNGASVGWSDRVPPDDIRWGGDAERFFFHLSEPPVNALAEQLAENPEQPFYVHVESAEPNEYIEVRYHTYHDEDFQFFSGSGPDPRPPATFFYPYRRAALWILLTGVAVYAVVPWEKRSAETICYPYRGIILGDLVAVFFFFAVFFGLPLFLVGGAWQTVTQAWFLLLLTWPFAFAGAWLLIHMAEYASFKLTVRDDGLFRATCWQRVFYPYSQMQYWQPLDQRQPAWFVALLWLAAATGKGGSSFTAAGQAITLQGMSCRGMRIAMKDDSAIYLWLNDQLGARAPEYVRTVVDGLRKAGVEGCADIKVVRTITMPEGEGPAVTRRHTLQAALLFSTLLFPLVPIGAVAGWYFVGDFLDSLFGAYEAYEAPPSNGPVDLGELTAENVVWERRLELAGTAVGSAILPLADGSHLLTGSTWPPGGSVQNAFLAKVDREGKELWSETYGGNQIDHVYRIVVLAGGDLLLLGKVADGVGFYAKEQACIRRVSAQGDLLWERLWSSEDGGLADFHGAHETAGEAMILGGCVDQTLCLLRLDAAGEVVTADRVDCSDSFPEGQIRWLTGLPDGGWLLVGEANGGEGRFVDLALARLDPEGSVMWARRYGEKRRESGWFVYAADSGDIFAAGTTDSGAGRKEQVYVVRCDSSGVARWTSTCGMKFSQLVTGLASTPEGGCVVVGESRSKDGRPSMMVAEIDHAGKLVEEQHIRRTNSGYTGSAVAVDSDGSRLVVGSCWLGDFQQQLVLLKLAR